MSWKRRRSNSEWLDEPHTTPGSPPLLPPPTSCATCAGQSQCGSMPSPWTRAGGGNRTASSAADVVRTACSSAAMAKTVRCTGQRCSTRAMWSRAPCTSASTSSGQRAPRLFAPLAGRVHSFKDQCASRRLRPDHHPRTCASEGRRLPHALWPPLARQPCRALRSVAPSLRATELGQLGDRTENGGWPPHVHFQVMLEIGDAAGDYPGVCRRSESARWLAVCPDPRPLLGLASD